ncbi:hypothetical protein [Streptomyces sp. NRRL F-2799]|uniref:hypothetical protein n=1 Tax=Streptomyces sp. NRRL F-2799 TaxID=1463844 RepID=UPI0005642EEC|nr:hypothetical protein [Streptomyces sp. NRRL F-2799]
MPGLGVPLGRGLAGERLGVLALPVLQAPEALTHRLLAPPRVTGQPDQPLPLPALREQHDQRVDRRTAAERAAPWGQIHQDRKLLTGDSPLASNALGLLSADVLVEAAKE